MSEKLQVGSDPQDVMDTSVKMPCKTKGKSTDMKDSTPANGNLDSTSPKSNRKLKSTLAPLKEATFATNIARKQNSSDVAGNFCGVTAFQDINFSEALHYERSPIVRIDYHKTDRNINHIQETIDIRTLSKTLINLNEDVGNKTKSSNGKVNKNKKTNKLTAVNNVDNHKLNKNSASSKITVVHRMGGNEKLKKCHLTNMVTVVNNMRRDPFCWKCHHDKPTVKCEACPRSFHKKCLKNTTVSDHWVCPVCTEVSDAETAKERSPALQKLSAEQFSNLLKFAIKRMKDVEGNAPFIVPVSEVDFPDYKKYVAQPQDLTCLERNIDANVYSSTQAFEADARWILHNSIIFNSNQSKLSVIAKSIMKICQQDMSEIEACATCYLNANTKSDWFVDVCPKPHLVVWAKLKSFPYWPAKVVRMTRSGEVDVRFFGAHDRAWVSQKDCILYCLQEPNTHKQKRNDINQSIKELNIYIKNLKRMYGEFCYAPYKVFLDPTQEIAQLQMLLPRYDPENIKPNEEFQKDPHQNNLSADFESSQENESEVLSQKKDEILLQIDDDILPKIDDTSDECPPSDLGSSDNTPKDDLTESNSIDIMQNTPIITTDITETACETSLTRKRPSDSDANDNPVKLSRQDDCKNINFSEEETPEEFCESKNIQEVMPVIENGHCEVTVETGTSSESSTSNSNELVLHTVSDLMDEESGEGTIVAETTSLLDIVSDNIDPILEKPLKLPVNTEQIPIISEPTSPTTSSKSAENVETVEIIEVNVIERPDPPGTALLVNMENVCQATDVPPSVSLVEHESDTVSKTILQCMEETARHVAERRLGWLEDDDDVQIVLPSFSKYSKPMKRNLNSGSSTGDFRTPGIVGIPEGMTIEVGDDSDEDILEISDTLTQPINTVETPTDPDIQKKCQTLKLRSLDKITNQPSNSPGTSITAISSSMDNNLDPMDPATVPLQSSESMLEKCLMSSSNHSDNCGTILLNNGTNSGNEENELKREYLLALNIAEKQPDAPKKQASIRTRSKSEERKFKFVGSISQIIDGFNSNCEIDIATKSLAQKRNDIFLKPLTTMVPKQRARKTFAAPARNMYHGPLHKKDVRLTKLIAPAASKASARTSPFIKPRELPSSSSSILFMQQPSSTTTTTVAVVQTNQALTRNSPMYAVVQQSNNYLPSTSASNTTAAECYESQNYIPLSGERVRNTANNQQRPPSAVFENNLENTVTHATPIVTSTSGIDFSVGSSTANTVNGLLEGLGPLSSLTPDALDKTINDVICKAAQRLKSRPPGPLSTNFEAAVDSSAGPLTVTLNSISQRLTEYFRGVVLEFLHDMSGLDNVDGLIFEIIKLNLKLEENKIKHHEDTLEVKKSSSSVLQDVRKSMDMERAQIVEETRNACEAEFAKRLEESKSKQWCSNCSKEAHYHCCYITCYCDFTCQKVEWPMHKYKCGQNIPNSQLLRKTPPPLTPLKSLLSKLTVHQANALKSSGGYVRTSESHMTFLESTPGNLELVGSGGPISVGGKVISGLNRIRANATPASSAPTVPLVASGVKGNPQKAIILAHTNLPEPTRTTSISDDGHE